MATFYICLHLYINQYVYFLDCSHFGLILLVKAPYHGLSHGRKRGYLIKKKNISKGSEASQLVSEFGLQHLR